MKLILSILLVAFLCFSSSLLFACPLVHGGKQILKSPMNVYHGVTEESPKAKFLPFGFVGGFLKGVALMGKDVVSGLYEMVQFPGSSTKKSCCSV